MLTYTDKVSSILIVLCALLCFPASHGLALSGPRNAPLTSLLGDPGMRDAAIRVQLEAWNFCNRCGPQASPSPRYADCYVPGKQGLGPNGNLVTIHDNVCPPPCGSRGLTPPTAFPGQPATLDPDLYAQAKERYLGELCATRTSTGQAWQFWTLMLKNGNLDRSRNLCKTFTVPGGPAPSPTPPPSPTPGLMNQPLVSHEWTSVNSSTGRVSGSFYGTYDIPSSSGSSSSSSSSSNTSYFSVVWSKDTGGSPSSASWLWEYTLRTSANYPWLMLYHRSDSVQGGSGGYPWNGRGVLLEHPTGTDVVLDIALNITYSDTTRAQFYLPELSGCWKPDGRGCDGDLSTDTTRYVCYVINPGVQAQCSASNQHKCPPYHRLSSTGEVVYRNDTARFPYQCYELWCAPPSIPGFSAREYCDPRSNPMPQELMQLLPCSEWGVHGFPAVPGQGWVGDPRTWSLNVGALGSQLYFSGTLPSPRYWVSLEVGPEMFEAGKTLSWTVQGWDVRAPVSSSRSSHRSRRSSSDTRSSSSSSGDGDGDGIAVPAVVLEGKRPSHIRTHTRISK